MSEHQKLIDTLEKHTETIGNLIDAIMCLVYALADEEDDESIPETFLDGTKCQ